MSLASKEMLKPGVNSDLEESIQQKEEIIKTLNRKIDQINIDLIENSASNYTLLDLKEEILNLKRKLYQNEDETSKIKKEMLKLEELNLELMKEIVHLKKQLQGGIMQGNELKKFKPEEDYVIKDQNFKLMGTNTRDSSYLRMLELKDENISCWKRDKCDLFEYQNRV